MTDFTTPSTAVLAGVAAAALGLGVMMWVASARLAQPKVRFLAAGFFVLFLKSLFAIYCIQTGILHHELLEMVDGFFDLVMVVLIATPFWLRR